MPLYLVSTPIGNLGDVTLRAIEVLKAADLVACEDTRHSQKLFQHLGIRPKTTSYHHHNRHQKIPYLVGLMREGRSVALVSDAGTPGISDPGEELVRACVEADLPVIPVPGASALLAGLAASGLPTGRFAFEGFLPAKAGERRRHLEAIRQDERTLVFYEAPHRLVEALAVMAEVLGARPACVARELTKLHETFQRGSLPELLTLYERQPPKGELVILVAGHQPLPVAKEQVEERLMALLDSGVSPSEAARRVAEELGVSRRPVYKRALELVGSGQ